MLLVSGRIIVDFIAQSLLILPQRCPIIRSTESAPSSELFYAFSVLFPTRMILNNLAKLDLNEAAQSFSVYRFI